MTDKTTKKDKAENISEDIQEAKSKLENILEDETSSADNNINQENEEPQQEEQKTENIQQESEIEIEARRQGWVPLSEWKGDPDKWRDPNSWVERGKLLDQGWVPKEYLTKLNSQVRQMADVNQALIKRLNANDEAKIIAQRREAIQNGDVEAVEKLDAQLMDIRKETDQYMSFNKPSQNPEALIMDEEAKKFAQRNREWFYGDELIHSEMKDFAIAKEGQIKNAYPSLPPAKLYIEVENAVKKQYPSYFGINSSANQGVTQVMHQPVATKNRAVKPNKKITYNDLPRAAQDIIDNFARVTKIDKDKYARQLVENGAIIID